MPQYVTMYEDWLKRDEVHIASIQTNLTNVCPQHCIMCHKPEWARIQQGRDGQLDPIHTANELNQMPYLETVVLSGGDPMNYRHLKEYITAIREPIKFGMFTTGIDNAINKYKDLPFERFGYIRFSIDGNQPETWAKIRGSFPRIYEIAWRNVLDTFYYFKVIFGASRAKERIRVQYTIQSENILEFSAMVVECYREDIPIYGYWVHDYNVVTTEQVNQLKADLLDLFAWYDSELEDWCRKWTNVHDIINSGDQVQKKLDPGKCIIPLVHAFIDTDGTVFPCCYLVADNLSFDQRDAKYSYGNIYEKPLKEILSNFNIRPVRNSWINGQNEICKSCCENKSRYYKVNLEAQNLRNRRPTFL